MEVQIESDFEKQKILTITININYTTYALKKVLNILILKQSMKKPFLNPWYHTSTLLIHRLTYSRAKYTFIRLTTSTPNSFQRQRRPFGMEDYHVLSMDNIDAPTVDSGVVLHVNDVAWAERQMWAPDAATKNGKYYLYFSAKTHNGIFQIGVAISDSPTGPFTPNHKPSKAVTALIQPFSKTKTGNTTFILAEFGAANFKKYRNNQYAEENEEPMYNEPAFRPHCCSNFRTI